MLKRKKQNNLMVNLCYIMVKSCYIDISPCYSQWFSYINYGLLGFDNKKSRSSREKKSRETGSAGPVNGAEAMTSMTWVFTEGTALGR